VNRRSFLTQIVLSLGLVLLLGLSANAGQAALKQVQPKRAAAQTAAKKDLPKKVEKTATKKVERPKPKPPLPFVPGSWTIVIMPDIQNYSTRFPGLTRLQTQWIVDHKDSRRIVYVLQPGDVTNNNLPFEWQRASRAFATLDAVVPYAIVTGNHDHRTNGLTKDRRTKINDYFPPSRFDRWPSFGGTMEPGRIENSYHLFEAGGRKWVVVALEFGPRDKALEWADGILAKYADRKAIVFTHAYLDWDSTRFDWAKKGMSQPHNPHVYGTAGGVNDGEEIWQKLIKKHDNVFLVMNGHIAGDGLGFQVSKTKRGTPVNEMAVDYQRQPIGGGAWLRLLEFLPDGKTVQARTYSPLYEQYRTGPEDQFTFEIYEAAPLEKNSGNASIPVPVH